MKIIVNNDSLRNALKVVSPAIGANSVIAALSCVKFSVAENILSLETSDLETTIRTEISCQSDESGVFCMEYKDASDLCAIAGAEALYIYLSIENNAYKIQIKSALGVNKYIGIAPDDFPKLPVLEVEAVLNFDGSLISKLSTAASFVSKDYFRPAMTGVCFDLRNNEFFLAGTNAQILYKSETANYEGSVNNCRVLPSKSAKIIASFPCAEIKISENFISAKHGDTEIYSRLIDAKYPDYNSVIPTYSTSFIADKAKLSAAIKNALLCAAKSVYSGSVLRIIDFSLSGNSLYITSLDVDFSKEGASEPFDIINNNVPDFKFRLEGLELLSCMAHLDDDIIFNTAGADNRAFILSSATIKDTLILMPRM